MFTFWLGTIVFFGTYILIASEKIHKTVAALLGASIMMFCILPGPGHSGSPEEKAPVEATVNAEIGESGAAAVQQFTETAALADGADTVLTETEKKAQRYDKLDTFARYSNFDVVFTLAGMMLLVNLLSGTGLFQYVAIKCAKLAKGLPIRTMILLVFATAFLSAFLDNVTTILLVAPVTLLVANELGVSPIPFLMAQTMASNLGGTATLIGDPPNLIIGSVAQLDFMAFLINLAPIVLLAMVIYCICLWAYYSRRMHVTVEKRALIMELDENAAISDHENLRRGGIVMLLTIAGFLLHGMIGIQPCVVAMAGAALALAICKVNVDHALEKIEWSTLFFFMALFILVCGAEECGLMAKIGSVLNWMNDWSPLAIVLAIMWGSAIAATAMNNVSFTAAMATLTLAFIQGNPVFMRSVELQHLLWWGLALSVCFGGNGSLVGAAANLVTVNIAAKNGHKVSFWGFMAYGMPVTIGSMVLATIYITIRYYWCCV